MKLLQQIWAHGGSRDGAVAEYLPPTQASHQCGSGSIPGLGVICGLSLLLVLVLAPRGFLRYSGFPLSSKTNTSNTSKVPIRSGKCPQLVLCAKYILTLIFGPVKPRQYEQFFDGTCEPNFRKHYVASCDCFPPCYHFHAQQIFMLQKGEICFCNMNVCDAHHVPGNKGNKQSQFAMQRLLRDTLLENVSRIK